MKSALLSILIAVVVLVGAWGMIAYADPVAVSERQRAAALRAEREAALAPYWQTAEKALAVSLAVGAGALAITVCGLGLAAIRTAANRSQLVFAQSGLYPAVVQHPDRWSILSRIPLIGGSDLALLPPPNEAHAQTVAALVQGNVERLPAGGVRAALAETPTQELLPAEDTSPVDAGEVVAVDPITRPHWLIVGQTGSGKSTATRFIMAQLAARHPCEWTICEPGGIDWNQSASAWTETGIAGAIAAVYAEMERRMALLREADAGHISELTNRPPYLYLVVEEMEAVLDNLRDLDKGLAVDTRINLRNIARMGRKSGVGLIAVTQAARTDVFDSHVRTNLANVLLFRNGQTTAEMFRIQERLGDLPTGVAYSLAHSRRVSFPLTPRPQLALSAVYQEAATAATTRSTVAERSTEPADGVIPATGRSVAETEPRHDQIYAYWQRHSRVLRRCEEHFFGYTGGEAHKRCAQAINAMLATYGQAPAYKEDADA